MVAASVLLVTAFCSGSPDRTDLAPGQIEEAPRNPAPLPEGETIVANRVRMVVGDTPITQIDVLQTMDMLRRARRAQTGNLEQAAVNQLVERAIVEIEARKETIIVTEARVDNEIRRRMEALGVTTDEEFENLIRREMGIPFDVFRDDLRFQLMKRQLIQIALTVEQPDEAAVERFYRQNRHRVGIEVLYREIILIPADRSVAAETRISRVAREVYSQVRANPDRFGQIARSTAANSSPYKAYGGLRPYAALHEVAEEEAIVAQWLNNLRPGQLSSVIRAPSGRYIIVKLEGKRPIPLDKVRDMIRRRLYFEKEEEAFEAWLEARRKQVAIQIIDE